MKKTFLGIAIIITFLLAGPVFAAQFESGNNYMLSEKQSVNGSLYAAGSNLAIDGNVNGDLFAAGSNITINGTTTQDLMAAGATINIFGIVKDDLRVAGANINISGPVGGEALVAGAQINISSKSVIEKDFYASGATINLNGIVKGNLKGQGNDLTINGTVEKNVEVTAENLKIGKDAVINGSLIYKGPKQAVIEDGAQIKGEVKYTPQESRRDEVNKPRILPILGIAWFFKLITSLVTGLVLYFLFRSRVQVLNSYALSNFGKELLRGLIILIILPIAIIIVAVTLIGFPLAMIGGLLYMLFIILAGIGAGFLLGSLVFKLFSGSKEYNVTWVSALVGIILVSVLNLIPILGWIFNFIFFLAAFGTLFNFSYRHFVPAK